MRILAVIFVLGFLPETVGFGQGKDHDHDYSPQGASLQISGENDGFTSGDRFYTHGMQVNYLGGDGNLPSWLSRLNERLPFYSYELQASRFGVVAGQSIYTPEDIRNPNRIPADRPYAGWLYAGLVLQRRGMAPVKGVAVLDHFQLELGVIGPLSGAEGVQKFAHRVTDSTMPAGWDHQLDNEPGVAAQFERTWRLRDRSSSLLGWNLFPSAGVSLGNVDTSLRAGLRGRLGWNLPDDFGVLRRDALSMSDGGNPRDRNRNRFLFYLHGGAEARGVAYSAFLDGNLFHGGHSVKKYYLAADFFLGAALGYGPAEVGYQHVFRTREYTEQDSDHNYGSIYARYKF